MLTITLPTSTTSTIPPAPTGERRPLLTPLSDPGHFLMVLDNTSLEKVKRCATAGEFYLVHRREAHARNAALTFGGALHEGLDGFYNGEDPTTQDSRIRSYFASNPSPLDEYRTVDNALKVMAAYRTRASFPDYHLEVMSDDNGPLIERAFELPLGVLEVNADIPNLGHVVAIHLAWSGRIDLVCHVHGATRVLDHKTTSISGDQFIQAFAMASQTLGYVWAARQLWPHLPVNGFCLNAIYFKKPPVGCTDLMAKGPRGGPPCLDFFRNYFDYSDERLLEWQHDTLATVEDFVHCLVRGLFPHNDRHCFDKYGQCPYHGVCTLDNPAVRQRFLMSEAFREVKWNPVTKSTV